MIVFLRVKEFSCDSDGDSDGRSDEGNVYGRTSGSSIGRKGLGVNEEHQHIEKHPQKDRFYKHFMENGENHIEIIYLMSSHEVQLNLLMEALRFPITSGVGIIATSKKALKSVEIVLNQLGEQDEGKLQANSCS